MGLTIADQYGVPWIVEAGDPCREATNLLKSKGYARIILRRETLVSGPPHGIMVETTAAALEPLAWVRLLDCNNVLKEMYEKT